VNAVDAVLNAGLRTADLAHGAPALSTEEMTDAILAKI
jgi:isocitrate/isopropylmalate dehydrogenase